MVLRMRVFIVALLIPLVTAVPIVIQGNYIYFQTWSGSGSCSIACGNMTAFGAGSCATVLVDSSSTSWMGSMFNSTSATVLGSSANGPTWSSGAAYYTGTTTCLTTYQYQICACNYVGMTPITPSSTYPNIITTVNNIINQIQPSMTTQTAGWFYPGVNQAQPSSLSAYPLQNVLPYSTITSVAADTTGNIYFTIGIGTTSTVSAPFLFVIQTPYSANSVKYTGISTCAYVFNVNTNVFCLGGSGLIQVV